MATNAVSEAVLRTMNLTLDLTGAVLAHLPRPIEQPGPDDAA